MTNPEKHRPRVEEEAPETERHDGLTRLEQQAKLKALIDQVKDV